MPSNVVSAILLTAIFFTSLAIAVDFAVDAVKSIMMVVESERAEEILQKFANLENRTFSFKGEGVIKIIEREIFIEYCGISEVLKAYSICYTYNFSKCVELYPKIRLEKGENGFILNVNAKKIFQSIVSEPGRHSIVIRKQIFSENRTSYELKSTTSDSGLNLSASISGKTICGEDLKLDIVAGESDEIRYVAIMGREELERVKGSSVEVIRESSKFFEEIGSGETSITYLINTSGWSLGYYCVLIFSSSRMNDDITFLLLANVSVDYGFSKLNLSDVEMINKNIEVVTIYEDEWHS